MVLVAEPEIPAAIPETTPAPEPVPVKVAPKKAAEPVRETALPKTGDNFMVMVKTLAILGTMMGVGLIVYANCSKEK